MYILNSNPPIQVPDEPGAIPEPNRAAGDNIVAGEKGSYEAGTNPLPFSLAVARSLARFPLVSLSRSLCRSLALWPSPSLLHSPSLARSLPFSRWLNISFSLAPSFPRTPARALSHGPQFGAGQRQHPDYMYIWDVPSTDCWTRPYESRTCRRT